MVSEPGYSAVSRLLTRSRISWILTVVGSIGRWGVSRRCIKSCRRSASLMMTWVYSLRDGLLSSCSSNWAAPGCPQGFLISWAGCGSARGWPAAARSGAPRGLPPVAGRWAGVRRGRALRTVVDEQRVTVQLRCKSLPVSPPHFDVLAGVAPVAGDGVGQGGLQGRRTGADLGELFCRPGTLAHRQEVLTGSIDVAHPRPASRDEDGGGQQVEAGERRKRAGTWLAF